MTETYNQIQPELFEFSDTVEGTVELFPEVWKALEMLISLNLEDRVTGFNRLIALNAHRLSPVVAHVLATCLDDEDLEFRLKVVQTVGGLLANEGSGLLTPLNIKRQLKYCLSKMRKRRIFALLQVAEFHQAAQQSVAVLLKACSYAGTVLADIFTDRKLPIEIRQQAIYFAGYVGFLETVPRLEKLAEKLETKVSGQRTMPFAPLIDPEEYDLLPTIHSALVLLKSP